ncbi:MAG TPA: hypothetical protein VJ761_17210, partial [Ktedonobacteraceae bacterium]|nr:hypothetical protein [Ktedonobacteraceae bacterium]
MATVPYEFECDKSSGFVMDPNEHKCVGYITAFRGLGMSAPLAQDLKVTLPYANPAPAYKSLGPVQSSISGHSTVEVVGVIEKFAWAGGTGDPVEVDFWVSQANAFQIKTLQQTTLKDTRIESLGFWIADYDQETKQWYEKAYPLGSGQLTGVVSNRENPELNVDLAGESARDGIDVMVYKISIKITPAANQTTHISLA